MPDSLTLFGTTYSNVAGFKAAASSSTVLTYIRPQGLLEVTENSSSIDVTQYATVSVNVEGTGASMTVIESSDVHGGTIVDITGGVVTLSLQSKVATPSTSLQYIMADSNYNGLSVVTVESIPSQYIIPAGTKIITANSSNIDVSQYATASVNVAGGGTINLQDKTNIDPTTSSQTITADNNYDGLNSVQINAIPSQYIIPAGTSTITANGTGIDIAAYASVDVAVPSPTLQAKSNITPTESNQTITADNGYYGLSSVQINAVSSTYVGSGIATRSDSDLTLNVGGHQVYLTAPAGYYSSGATKHLTVKGGETFYPSNADRTISADRYLYDDQIIKAVTTSNITAANIKTGVTVQVGDTSNAGRLVNVTGTFTSDATASAADIVSSKTAYVNGSKITGSLIISTYYTGSGTPSAGLGVDGDIYFQTT